MKQSEITELTQQLINFVNEYAAAYKNSAVMPVDEWRVIHSEFRAKLLNEFPWRPAIPFEVYHFPCVYMLIQRGLISHPVYVGSTINLQKRMKQHHIYRCDLHDVAYVPFRLWQQLDLAEYWTIQIVNPPLNIVRAVGGATKLREYSMRHSRKNRVIPELNPPPAATAAGE